MKFDKSGIPAKEGFYFVKRKEAMYWQVFARVVGKAPFFRIAFSHSLFKTNDNDIMSGDITELDWSDVMELHEYDSILGKHFMGLNITEPQAKEVISLINDGSKLAAVKFFKEITGFGLREAKDFCDNLQINLKNQ
jgi:hypothetical protein